MKKNLTAARKCLDIGGVIGKHFNDLLCQAVLSADVCQWSFHLGGEDAEEAFRRRDASKWRTIEA